MKTILVTGVSAGLGLEIVKELLKEPSYSIVGIGRTAPPGLTSDRFRFVSFDLGDCDAIGDLYKTHLHQGPPIAGLVNNAASAYDDLVTNAQLEPLEAMFRLNVFAPMLLTKCVLRNMILHNTPGSFAHVSSLSVHTGFKGLAMYASTKGALEAFSLGISREYGSRGIRSNCVAPGFMTTRMTSGLEPEKLAKIARRASLQKVTDPADVARTIAFLLSPAAGSITGTTVRVDAGSL